MSTATIMLLYKSVAPLSRDLHRHLKIKPTANLSFAAHTHWMPLGGVEFQLASHHYPIVFVADGSEDDLSVVPIALLGLEPGENAFVRDGQWQPHAYLPAFARRYPSVLAHDDTAATDNFNICIDTSYEGLNESDGTALFHEDGSNSAYLEEIINLLTQFRWEMERTRSFVALLQQYQLLQRKSADVRSPSGVPFQVHDFLVVDESRFAALSGEELVELHRQGFLDWIHAHLFSLSNLPGLVDMHAARHHAH